MKSRLQYELPDIVCDHILAQKTVFGQFWLSPTFKYDINNWASYGNTKIFQKLKLVIQDSPIAKLI